MNWRYCLLDDAGNFLKGWQNVKGVWYFLDNKGLMATGWIKNNDKWYYLDSSGAMKISWLQYGGCWYYLKANGEMATGWLSDKGNWYYLKPEDGVKQGSMYQNCTVQIEGKSYTFNNSGAWVKNPYLFTEALINFTKAYEGFRAHAYDDGTGVLTIGYGTINKKYTSIGAIDEATATQALKEEMSEKAQQIKNSLNNHGVSLTQYQFDSLCDFAYNLGIGGLLDSTLYKLVLNGTRGQTLKDELLKWTKSNNPELRHGLIARRTDEYNMFTYADYARNY